MAPSKVQLVARLTSALEAGAAEAYVRDYFPKFVKSVRRRKTHWAEMRPDALLKHLIYGYRFFVGEDGEGMLDLLDQALTAMTRWSRKVSATAIGPIVDVFPPAQRRAALLKLLFTFYSDGCWWMRTGAASVAFARGERDAGQLILDGAAIAACEEARARGPINHLDYFYRDLFRAFEKYEYESEWSRMVARMIATAAVSERKSGAAS
jgi:hypothetical protein